MERRHLGAHNELVATVWLLKAGYAVFRNVSQHGPVDIIAMKDDELEMFDVKACPLDRNGNRLSVRVTEEQKALRVKLLYVMPDGSCEIDHEPLAFGEAHPPRPCPACSVAFAPFTRQQVYCSPACWPSNSIRYGPYPVTNGH